MLDIREMYERFGEMHPGKKGISLTAAQWRALTERRGDIDAALERAKR